MRKFVVVAIAAGVLAGPAAAQNIGDVGRMLQDQVLPRRGLLPDSRSGTGQFTSRAVVATRNGALISAGIRVGVGTKNAMTRDGARTATATDLTKNAAG